MGNDVSFIFGQARDDDDVAYAVLKVIEDTDGVRLKVCPREPGQGTYDETDEAREVSLNRAGVQRLIRDLRKMRDRVFGPDE